VPATLPKRSISSSAGTQGQWLLVLTNLNRKNAGEAAEISSPAHALFVAGHVGLLTIRPQHIMKAGRYEARRRATLLRTQTQPHPLTEDEEAVISGVQQHQSGSERKVTFKSQKGEVDLATLKPAGRIVDPSRAVHSLCKVAV